MIAREDIMLGGNVRLKRNLRTRELAEDIRANGLKSRIVVGKIGKETHLIAGFRRMAAIELGFKLWPNTLKGWFPGGKVPVIVKSGLSAEEIEAEKCDHGNMVGLSHKFEITLSVEHLRRAGLTEKDIATKLAGVLDTVYPLEPSARKKKDAFDEKIAEARGMAKVKLEAEKAEWYLGYRRGIIQNHVRIVRTPKVIWATEYYKAEGEKPEGFDGVNLPSRLTQSQIRKLDKAHKADMDDVTSKVNGISKFSREIPGPLFSDLWASILEAEAKEGPMKAVRAKAMSAKDMRTELTEGAWKSEGFRRLTAHHSGEEIEGLTQADAMLYYAELASKYAKDAWKACVAVGKDAEKALREGKEPAKV